MKKVLAIILMALGFGAHAQTVTGKRLVAAERIYLKDTWINQFEKDTLFADDNSVPTSLAVRKFVEGRISNNFANTDLTATGDRNHNFKSHFLKLDSLSSYYALATDGTLNSSQDFTPGSIDWRVSGGGKRADIYMSNDGTNLSAGFTIQGNNFMMDSTDFYFGKPAGTFGIPARPAKLHLTALQTLGSTPVYIGVFDADGELLYKYPYTNQNFWDTSGSILKNNLGSIVRLDPAGITFNSGGIIGRNGSLAIEPIISVGKGAAISLSNPTNALTSGQYEVGINPGGSFGDKNSGAAFINGNNNDTTVKFMNNGNVGLGSKSITNEHVQLEVNSPGKVVVFDTMTTAKRDGITNHVTGYTIITAGSGLIRPPAVRLTTNGITPIIQAVLSGSAVGSINITDWGSNVNLSGGNFIVDTTGCTVGTGNVLPVISYSATHFPLQKGWMMYNVDSSCYQSCNGTGWDNMRQVSGGSGSGGGGETNTASNSGAGLGVYDNKVGVDLQFNSFKTTTFSLTAHEFDLNISNLKGRIFPTNSAGALSNDGTGNYSWNIIPIGESSITAPNTVKKYWTGYKTWGSLFTDSLNEGTTNLFYTNARARAALSATGTGISYNAATGVFTGSGLSLPQLTDSLDILRAALAAARDTIRTRDGVVLDTISGKVYIGLSFKVYIATLSSSSGDAPVANVLENTFGGEIVWSRNAAGDYTGTFAGAFTTNKTTPIDAVHILDASAGAGGNMGVIKGYRIDDDTYSLLTGTANDGLADEILNNTMIEIRVYK